MKLIKTARLAAAVLAPLALAACSSLPPYQPAAGETVTTLTKLGFGNVQICRDGKMQDLAFVKKDGMYSANIPVGKRIGLIESIKIDAYQVVSTCMVRLSVVPRAGVGLFFNGGLSSSGKCFAEIVREDKERETGVALEPSVSGPSC